MLLTRSAPWYIVWQSSSTYASLGPKPIVYGPWTVSALCLERFRCFVYYLLTISRTLYCRLGTQQLQHQSKLSSWYFHWSVKDLVSSMLVAKMVAVATTGKKKLQKVITRATMDYIRQLSILTCYGVSVHIIY